MKTHTPAELVDRMLVYLLPRVPQDMRRTFINPDVLAQIERMAVEQCLHTCVRGGADHER